MSGPSSIEWTDATWNPVRGCTRVSEGCRNCYAEAVAARFSGPNLPYEGLATREGGKTRWTGKLSFGHALEAPLRWRRPRQIFVNSMSDLFHEGLADHEIATVLAVAVAAHHLRGHTLQILTKRAARMRALLTSEIFWKQVNAEASMHVLDGTDLHARRSDDARATLDTYGPAAPPPGIWFGVSCEDQEAAAARVPELLATPAAVRFVSAEPLLGPIDFLRTLRHGDARDWLTGERWLVGQQATTTDRLDWIIAGGESGPRARPMHPQWARDIRDQCAAAGVPFFFKQWGEWADAEAYPSEIVESFDVQGRSADGVIRVGKKTAGRLLDGVEHNGMPQVPA